MVTLKGEDGRRRAASPAEASLPSYPPLTQAPRGAWESLCPEDGTVIGTLTLLEEHETAEGKHRTYVLACKQGHRFAPNS